MTEPLVTLLFAADNLLFQMSDDKSTAPTVTDEPGREEPKPSESAKDATEDETLPSLNPLPSAWLSAGASWFNTAKEKVSSSFMCFLILLIESFDDTSIICDIQALLFIKS